MGWAAAVAVVRRRTVFAIGGHASRGGSTGHFLACVGSRVDWPQWLDGCRAQRVLATNSAATGVGRAGVRARLWQLPGRRARAAWLWRHASVRYPLAAANRGQSAGVRVLADP